MDLLQELAEPFERMTPAAASALLREHYGLEPLDLELLDTERDDSFRVSTVDGYYVLKIANPADTAGYIDLQNAALTHLDGRMPVQRVIAARDGNRAPVVDDRIVRVLSWLPGALLRDQPADHRQLVVLGATLAQLDANLAAFEHPAARRTFAWDLQGLQQLRHLPHSETAERVFDAAAELELASLPQQVIHNDFHPGNLLVDPAAPGYVVGILDFGDLLFGPRVQDVAVALAYQLPESGDPAPTIAAFVDGYACLTAEELRALPTLIAGRLVQRILLPPLFDPTIDTGRLEGTLANLLKES